MNKPHRILTTSLAFLAGLASSLPIFGSEAVLTDDTTANRVIPRAFYHTQPTLGVAATIQGVGRLAFLKFDLLNLPAGTPSAQISKATLRVYCDAITKPGLIDIAPVMEPWIESSVTGAVSPALGEVEVAGTPVTLAAKRHWVSFDVTQLVRDWADGTFPNNGLALVPKDHVRRIAHLQRECLRGLEHREPVGAERVAEHIEGPGRKTSSPVRLAELAAGEVDSTAFAPVDRQPGVEVFRDRD